MRRIMGDEVIAVAFVFVPMMIFPMTWVWMLLYGSLGFDHSYAESLPLGLLSVLLVATLVMRGARPQRAPAAPSQASPSSVIRL